MCSRGFHFAFLLMEPNVTEKLLEMLANNLGDAGFQTSQTINNSIIFSAAVSLEPICFKRTLFLLTMQNTL